MVTHTDWMLLTAVMVWLAPNPVNVTMSEYGVSTLPGSSGRKNGAGSVCETMPHTGQVPTPEQLGSSQSVVPLQSLSIPSLQVSTVFSGPLTVQPGTITEPSGTPGCRFASAPMVSSPPIGRADGPQANSKRHEAMDTIWRVRFTMDSMQKMVRMESQADLPVH